MTPQSCAAVVVGAGPAGIAVMGNLLELGLNKIAWVDPSFDGGRVNRKYREVPSNTKVLFFQAFATGTQPFRRIIRSTPLPNAFSTLMKLDQDQTCSLHYAADMCRALTDGLLKMDAVVQVRGEVVSADLDDTTSQPQWTVHIRRQGTSNDQTATSIITPRLILCTGSDPTTPSIPIDADKLSRLDLDTVLQPSTLYHTLPRTEPLTIAVVGGSHSAVLALMNLYELARATHPQLRIKWFTRHALRYAEYRNDEHGAWILRDNTGLKGQAAEFAWAQLEDDKLPQSDAGRFIQKIPISESDEMDLYAEHLPQCTHIVHAIGFTRSPLPTLTIAGDRTKPIQDQLQWDSSVGGFLLPCGKDTAMVVPGLHGAGIAFPERVRDPFGNVEWAVGFFKFMKFLRRVCPMWV
ncbi:hypothetical protein VTN49DRAFT_6118 [Thermomyces lanuginosus]|uniref:uncharacterized protein n=1 Tax=Thermomyces lanuginosus TaxID=5541 RepID=UPI003742894A